MCSIELFDHLYISRQNSQNDRFRVQYIVLYRDHFLRIPLYTYISFNGPLACVQIINEEVMRDIDRTIDEAEMGIFPDTPFNLPGMQISFLYLSAYLHIYLTYILSIYRVFRKNCVFFTIHCNPSLAYIAVRDLQGSHRNASVQSLLLAGDIQYNQQQPSAGQERWQTFENS